ncbi:MAG: glycosyltransferase N-terminal domain-containing protein [Akkermansia sp.]
MNNWLIRLIYNILYRVFLLISLPGYLMKMKRRGGIGTGLMERFGRYKVPFDQEPKGGLYIHAVSVGEVMIALKFIRAWMDAQSGSVVLATSTATGHATALKAAIPGVRVIYSPLDTTKWSERCLNRFQPQIIALVEAELWPNFARIAGQKNIPIAMINARLSQRSEQRYASVKWLSRFFYAPLAAVGVQDKSDAMRFVGIGVSPDVIRITGSIKFDQDSLHPFARRPEFEDILHTLSRGKPIILAASTHAGEELLIATAIKAAGGFPLIVPRHAERRQEIRRSLDEAGWQCILRTDRQLPQKLRDNLCYIVDTTGELRDWTSFADIVVIGKSFLAEGGQNPAEAVAASVPVVTGPHMENFAALMNLLTGVDGVTQCFAESLPTVLKKMLQNPLEAHAQASRAHIALKAHAGATKKSVQMLQSLLAKDDTTILGELGTTQLVGK